MRKSFLLLLIAIFGLNAKAQSNQDLNNDDLNYKYIMWLDSDKYMFIDNSYGSWHTLEIKADTLYRVQDNIYVMGIEPVQIGTIKIQDIYKNNIIGSPKEEKAALLAYKKWEFNYQKETIGKNLKSGEEFFTNKNGKQFLIWWLEVPKTMEGNRTVEIEPIDKSKNNSNLTRATHQLFLNFTTLGKAYGTFTISVFKEEKLSDKIQQLKQIANSLNMYGSYIDLDFLIQKVGSKNNVAFKDSLNLIEIKVPEWLNVYQSGYNSVFTASFPEKDNIINAVSVFWVEKGKWLSPNFQGFIDIFSQSQGFENIKQIKKEKDYYRFSYTANDNYFYGQCVFIESENVYCWVNFVATETTYNFNLGRFNELLQNIKLK